MQDYLLPIAKHSIGCQLQDAVGSEVVPHGFAGEHVLVLQGLQAGTRMEVHDLPVLHEVAVLETSAHPQAQRSLPAQTVFGTSSVPFEA